MPPTKQPKKEGTYCVIIPFLDLEQAQDCARNLEFVSEIGIITHKQFEEIVDESTNFHIDSASKILLKAKLEQLKRERKE